MHTKTLVSGGTRGTRAVRNIKV